MAGKYMPSSRLKRGSPGIRNVHGATTKLDGSEIRRGSVSARSQTTGGQLTGSDIERGAGPGERDGSGGGVEGIPKTSQGAPDVAEFS